MNGEGSNSFLEGSEGGSFVEPSLPLVTGPAATP